MSFSKKKCQRNHTVVGRRGAFWPYYLDIYNQITIWIYQLACFTPPLKKTQQKNTGFGCLSDGLFDGLCTKKGRILRFDLPFACLRNVESLCQI